MKKVIYKYTVEVGYNTLYLPKDSIILHLGDQKGSLTLWVLLDLDEVLTELHEIYIVGTGWSDIQDSWKYLGTVQQGSLVWHAFYIKYSDKLTEEILERHDGI